MALSDIWQIQAPGFAAQSFASLGFSDLKIQKKSAGVDTATFRAVGKPFDSAFFVPWGAFCTILKSGNPWFAGALTKPMPSGSGSAESIDYELSGPWWDLEQCIYMQKAMFSTAGEPPALALTPLLTLGYEWAPAGFVAPTPAFGRITTGQQITLILKYAITCGARLQVGNINPGIFFPTSEVKAENAAKVIQKLLQWVPDQVLSFDYTTSPPTLNLVKRSNAKSVSFAIPGPPADTVKLTPRNDLQVPMVGIYYTATNVVGGSSYVQQTEDVYPPGANPAQLRALVTACQLAGSKVNLQQQKVVTTVIPASGHQSDREIILWFQKHCSPLKGITPASLSVVAGSWFGDVQDDQTDVNGNDISEDFTPANLPNELLIGSITPWMAAPAGAGDGGITTPGDGYVHGAKIDFAVELSYDPSSDIANGNTDSEDAAWEAGLMTGPVWAYATVVATDAQTKTYVKPTSVNYGDTQPAGVAQYLYEALNLLHFEGDFKITEQECSGGIQVGQALNLTGGRAEWAEMEAQVQQITEEIDSGMTTAKLGPPKLLSVQNILELLRNWRSMHQLGVDGSGGTLESRRPGRKLPPRELMMELDRPRAAAGR